MAARDIQIQRRVPVPSSTPLAGEQSPVVGGDESDKAVLPGALRRRWWFYLLTVVLSAGLAYVVCTEYRTFSSVSKATLIRAGLPSPPGPRVDKPLNADTCADLLVSYAVLNRLRAREELGMPLQDLASRVKVKASSSSDLLQVSLAWDDPAEGVRLLNGLLEEFGEATVAHRRVTVRDQIRHVQAELVDARAELHKAQEELDVALRRQQGQKQESGFAEDQYRSTMLNDIVKTKSLIGEREAEKAGRLQQMEMLEDQMLGERRQMAQLAVQKLQEAVLLQALFLLEVVREPHAVSSDGYRRLTAGQAILEEFGTNYVIDANEAADEQMQRWYNELTRTLQQAALGLPVAYFVALDQAYQKAYEVTVAKLDTILNEQRRLVSQRQDLELSILSFNQEIAMLQERLQEYQATAKNLHERATKTVVDAAYAPDQRVQEAETRKDGLVALLDNLRQHEECHTPEWSVIMPATMDTTELASNRKLLFAITFGICMLAFAGPMFLVGTVRERSSQVAFAQSLRLPILAERMLEDFLPDQRGQIPTVSQLSEERVETLRMLALRIQQSVHRPGAVILFTGLDTKTSAFPLMAAVGEYLAAREERVLLVDAVSPDRSGFQVLNLSAEPEQTGNSAEPHTPAAAAGAADPGLAEYLSQESSNIRELIRSTPHPGVDFIASGRKAFPREAMASSYLTALLDACRKEYTMVLVNGPSARYAADVQMLAARADGVVLTANDRVKKDAQAAAVVKELVELGAPIMGVVA